MTSLFIRSREGDAAEMDAQPGSKENGGEESLFRESEREGLSIQPLGLGRSVHLAPEVDLAPYIY